MSLCATLLEYGGDDLVRQLKEYAALMRWRDELDVLQFVRDSLAGNAILSDGNEAQKENDKMLQGRVCLLINSCKSEMIMALGEGHLMAMGIPNAGGQAVLIPKEYWHERDDLNLLEEKAVFEHGKEFVSVTIRRNRIEPNDGRTGEPGRPHDLTLPFVKKYQEIEASDGSLAANQATAKRIIRLVLADGYSGKVPTERGIIKAILRFKAAKERY